MIDPDFNKVLEYTKSWGIPVRFKEPVEKDFRNEYHRGPDRSWIYWPKRTIYWPEPEKNDNAQSLLHELSHCVVGTYPVDVDEIDGGLLAFQLLSSRHLHLREWFRWAQTFNVNGDTADPYDFVTYDTRSHRQRSKILRDSFKGAIAAGILTPQGAPTFKKQRRKPTPKI